MPASQSILLSTQNRDHESIVLWDDEEKGIRIFNEKRLAEEVLPKYYRHNKYSSFVRQLNIYGFQKIKLTEENCLFLHPDFDPDRYGLS